MDANKHPLHGHHTGQLGRRAKPPCRKHLSTMEARGAESSTPIVISECNLAVDVILASSDGVHFGFHTQNILIFAGAFPACDTEDSNVISLSESADVVSLLLQYMHQQRQPDSSKFKFDILSRLADAVEKYNVFSAIEVCNIHMR
jgi:hypothetical protein